MHWGQLLAQRQLGLWLVLECCHWLELGQEQTAGQRSRGQQPGLS